MSLLPEKLFRSFTAKIFIFVSLIMLLMAVAVYFAYQPNSEFYGKVLTHLSTTQKIVALTFDDGPNGDATLQVLQTLKNQKIRATFFMIGDNVLYYPDIAKQVAEDGNEIGNHTMHHSRLLPFADSNEVREDLLATNEIIFNATGQNPKFFRPPFGFRTPWVIDSAERSGFTVVTWNDLTVDYEKSATSEQIQKNILQRVRPGSIIVLHDGFDTHHGADRSAMLAALPKIIDSLKAQGYQFVTLGEFYRNYNAK